MGGAVSELRAEIHRHVVIARRYPLLLEPQLAALQFFLRTAESGEGAATDRALDDIPVDVVMTNKKLFEEASTEVELLVENAEVMRVLLHALSHYTAMQLAPPLDPFLRWYEPPWRRGHKPMPRFLEIPRDQVPRFRVAVLRSSVRCLRLLMFCSDGRPLLEQLHGPELLDRAARENPLDDYVKRDVKAIFKAVYGGDNAVRRIAIGDVPTVVEMATESAESAIVQLAAVQRLCKLLGDVDALMYIPPAIRDGDADNQNAPDGTDPAAPLDAMQQRRCELFATLDANGAVSLVAATLSRFDVDKFLALYVHVCRFVAFVALEPRNAKLIGQAGGVDGAVRLLLKARELQRAKRHAEKQAAALQAQRDAMGQQDDWAQIMEAAPSSEVSETDATTNRKTKHHRQPPPAPLESGQPVASLESLAVVDFTPTEIGQQAMWALDLLAQLDFNVAQMKRCKLKYLLEEIRLDPEQHELGAALIITRRLRLIRWDEITGLAPEEDEPTMKRSPSPQSRTKLKANGDTRR